MVKKCTSPLLLCAGALAGIATLVGALASDASSMTSAAFDVRVLLHGLGVAVLGSPEGLRALPWSSPNLARDAATCAIFSLVFFALNWGFRLLVVEPPVRMWLRLRSAKLAKFGQSVMEAANYGTFAFLGICVASSQDWLWPSSQWWIGAGDGGHAVMRSDLRCFYIMYMARYLQAIVSVLMEARRKDFVEMMVHHVVTVGLVSISYAYGYNRVGLVTMLLMDPADVPLHCAKLCKYTADANGSKAMMFVADRLFELFAVTFFVTRLALFGYVCWSAHIESGRYMPLTLDVWMCIGMLYAVLVLQIMWFSLIVKLAIVILSGGDATDPRSDDEDEDECQVAPAPAKPGTQQ